ncbi:C-GCAxxG-C-C family (seleno)protein [Clostridium uliginosum]|uniref:C_GCAxxG_C_C family probable redox protein n=1 Tax=Clostridium uliginosum TaxID=119641 RepID=A0A1I1JBH7_9CLOT|nr:C-GCAxxG-C-C family (seleno)protein [Clostridium uliginosum]SFC43293.1 C_GCAxxG_C_C family probable redox protein [Clostridium uliginosum]
MLKEMVKKYWNDEYDLNCAECLIYAANEEYDLKLSHETLKTMAAFGGGMAVGDVCGVISGSIAVIGIMFTEVSGHKTPAVRDMTREFIKIFKERLGSNNCIELRKQYRKSEDGCIVMVETASEVLEKIIQKGKGW